MEAASHGWKRANELQTAFRDQNGNMVTKLQYGGIPKRMQLWHFCDCSSFVWACYAELGLSAALGWEKWNDPKPEAGLNAHWNVIVAGLPGNCISTLGMYEKFAVSSNNCRRLWGFPSRINSGQHALMLQHCTSGDIVMRVPPHNEGSNHVGIVWKITGNTVSVLHAGSEGNDIYMTEITGKTSYNCAVRPHPSRSS